MLPNAEEILKNLIQRLYFANSGILDEDAHWQIGEKAAELGLTKSATEALKRAVAREAHEVLVNSHLAAQPPLPLPTWVINFDETAKPLANAQALQNPKVATAYEFRWSDFLPSFQWPAAPSWWESLWTKPGERNRGHQATTPNWQVALAWELWTWPVLPEQLLVQTCAVVLGALCVFLSYEYIEERNSSMLFARAPLAEASQKAEPDPVAKPDHEAKPVPAPASLAGFSSQRFTGRYRGEYTNADGQALEVWLDISSLDQGQNPATFQYNLRIKEVGGGIRTRLFAQQGTLDPTTQKVMLPASPLGEFALATKPSGQMRLSSLAQPALVLE
jgi:hypothetical protein